MRTSTRSSRRARRAGTVPLRKKTKSAELSVEEILDEMKVELDARCKTLELHTEHLADTLKNAFMVEFTRIPKKIREMPLKKFFEEFDGSMEVVLEHDKRQCFAEATAAIPSVSSSEMEVEEAGICATVVRGSRHKSKTGAPSSSAKPPRARSKVPATPSAAFRGGVAPATPSLRMPRTGEGLLSVRGSPLGNFSSLRAVAGKTAAPPTISVALTSAPDTGFIDISDANVQANLTEVGKAEAFQHLQALQRQVASLMEKIQTTQK